MNPLTLVKRTRQINSTEAKLGISEEASWHAKYKDSAYVFVGGIPFDLTEGDLLAVFAQYGEVVDVNLVRDKGTGKSKGFAFLAYEDQRSTILAVDNLNGAKLLGRIIRVDHVSNYKKKEEEDEEKEQQKREGRGVCYAFQRGECNRGAACKYSHDEQRCANTGWGAKDSDSRWGHDKFDGLPKSHKNFLHNSLEPTLQHRVKEGESKAKSLDKGDRYLRSEVWRDHANKERKQTDLHLKDEERQGSEKLSERANNERKQEDRRDRQKRETYTERHKSREDREDDLERRRSDKRPRHERESSTRSYRREEEEHQNRARR